MPIHVSAGAKVVLFLQMRKGLQEINWHPMRNGSEKAAALTSSSRNGTAWQTHKSPQHHHARHKQSDVPN